MAKKTSIDEPDLSGGRIHVPRSRGAASGLLLILLGAWAALIPLVGPYVHIGYQPNTTWHVTTARAWLEILPGAVTAFGGLLLMLSANRITASFGGWLASAGGAWLIVGPAVRPVLHIGSIGAPIHSSSGGRSLDTLLLFTGVGALILFLAATALGRLAVVGVRDIRAARRRESAEAEEQSVTQYNRPPDADEAPKSPPPPASQPDEEPDATPDTSRFGTSTRVDT